MADRKMNAAASQGRGVLVEETGTLDRRAGIAFQGVAGEVG
jgi:hypothetical protein